MKNYQRVFAREVCKAMKNPTSLLVERVWRPARSVQKKNGDAWPFGLLVGTPRKVCGSRFVLCSFALYQTNSDKTEHALYSL
jgi:hypothetical protein